MAGDFSFNLCFCYLFFITIRAFFCLYIESLIAKTTSITKCPRSFVLCALPLLAIVTPIVFPLSMQRLLDSVLIARLAI